MSNDYGKEVNFQEAIANCFKCFVSPQEVSCELEQVLTDENATNPAIKTPFWILVAALNKFKNKHSTLPVNGSIPDMTSDTDSYIALQKMYTPIDCVLKPALIDIRKRPCKTELNLNLV
jgi:NEDD8-activating enzyme E1 regulatory subunit